MKNNSIAYETSKTRRLVLYSFFISIVFLSTYLIQFTLPLPGTGGLVHAGNIAAFTIAIVFGKKYGAVAGGFGMALFDILSGWVIWAPGTFIIRYLCGYVIGFISNSKASDGKSFFYNTLALLAGSLIIIVGYYFYQVLLYQNFVVALGSIPGDILQCVFGIIGALFLVPILNKKFKV